MVMGVKARFKSPKIDGPLRRVDRAFWSGQVVLVALETLGAGQDILAVEKVTKKRAKWFDNQDKVLRKVPQQQRGVLSKLSRSNR